MATINAINSNIPIEVTLGGTAAITLTSNGVLVGAGTGAVSGITAGSTGQLLVGTTSSNPAFGTSANGDFTFTSATSGATRTLTVSNSSNTASSTALVSISTAGALAGDAALTVTTTTTSWTLGVDNSVTSPTADPFVIAQGTALGTNNAMSIDTSGAINYPLQPAFLAEHTSAQNDITGDATIATINFTTVIFDQASNYDGTNKFTAPVTGKYLFVFSCLADQVSGGTNANIRIVTTNRSYIGNHGNFSAMAAADGTICTNMSILANMTAADTATCALMINNVGAKTSDCPATTPYTFFAGYLVC